MKLTHDLHDARWRRDAHRRTGVVQPLDSGHFHDDTHRAIAAVDTSPSAPTTVATPNARPAQTDLLHPGHIRSDTQSASAGVDPSASAQPRSGPHASSGAGTPLDQAHRPCDPHPWHGLVEPSGSARIRPDAHGGLGAANPFRTGDAH